MYRHNSRVRQVWWCSRPEVAAENVARANRSQSKPQSARCVQPDDTRSLLPAGASGSPCNFAAHRYVVFPIPQFNLLGLAGWRHNRKLVLGGPRYADTPKPPIRKTMRRSLSSIRLRRNSTTVACSLAPQSLCRTLATYRPSGETTLCPMRSLHNMRWQPGRTSNNVASETNTIEAPMEEGRVMDARHCIATRGPLARQQSDPAAQFPGFFGPSGIRLHLI